MSNDADTKITHKSWVPLGAAVSVGLGLFSGGFVVSHALDRMEARLSALEGIYSDRWTLTDMEHYAYRMEHDNRAVPLTVPDVREIKRLGELENTRR